LPGYFYCPIAVLYNKAYNNAEADRGLSGFSVYWVYELSIRKTGNIYRYLSFKTYFGCRFGDAGEKKEAVPIHILLSCFVIISIQFSHCLVFVRQKQYN
jgi:hypothetical protein